MPISCSDYDYIEIVCMFNYPVTLMMKEQGNIITVEGIALDTKRNSAKQECIEIVEPDHKKSRLIELTSLISMTINQDNPHFKTISFKP